MNFKQWLEDTGEVRTASISNSPLGIPSKYTTDDKYPKNQEGEFPDPFGKTKRKKLNKKKEKQDGESASNN